MMRDRRFQLAAYILADVIATGMGMGVPIFNILLGFVVGWIMARIQPFQTMQISRAQRSIIRIALLTSSLTFLLMAIIWLPTISILFDPGKDIENFGIPMILFDPLASFIGWIVLMVLISPFLQVLTTVFAANASLATRRPNSSDRKAAGE